MEPSRGTATNRRETTMGSKIGYYTSDSERHDIASRSPFEMYELEAFLGDFASDYDIAAIIDDATAIDYSNGNRYWLGVDLAEVCEQHRIK